MPTVLVTGANRGLGLEFARQYAAAGWHVFACCRNPDDARELNALAEKSPKAVSVHRLDVRDRSEIADLAYLLADRPIDILLNNAGVYGPSKVTLGHIDYDAWADVFAVNTVAPLRMAECFLENVARDAAVPEDVRALRVERVRERAAEPAGGARDENGLAAQM